MFAGSMKGAVKKGATSMDTPENEKKRSEMKKKQKDRKAIEKTFTQVTKGNNPSTTTKGKKPTPQKGQVKGKPRSKGKGLQEAWRKRVKTKR